MKVHWFYVRSKTN